MPLEFNRKELLPAIAAGDNEALLAFSNANFANILNCVRNFKQARQYRKVDIEQVINIALEEMAEYLQGAAGKNIQNHNPEGLLITIFNERFHDASRRLYGKPGSRFGPARDGNHTGFPKDVKRPFVDRLKDKNQLTALEILIAAEDGNAGQSTPGKHNIHDWTKRVFVEAIEKSLPGTTIKKAAELYFLEGKDEKFIQQELGLNSRPSGHLSKARRKMIEHYPKDTPERTAVEVIINNHKNEIGRTFREIAFGIPDPVKERNPGRQ